MGFLEDLKSKFASFNLSGGGSCVGLSIGTSTVKIAELKKSGRSWKLLHFGYVQLPDECVVNREIVNSVAVVESIRTLLGQIRLKNVAVCTSITGTGVITKRMTVEVPNAKELQDQVFWEAEQYLPFDVSEVYLDYQVLSRSKSGTTDVLLVAAKKSVVDGYMAVVEQAGLKPKIVDLDYFALQNVLEANYPMNATESVAVIDIGASSMKMVVVHGGIPVFTKDSTIGGRGLTSEIQKHLSLSFADAESLKVAGQGGTMPQEVADLIHVMCENVATEIKRSIDLYNAQSSGAPISYVLLTGGSAKIAGLSKMVEDQIGLPAQTLNPFGSISYDSSHFTQDQLSANAAMAAVPIGLALRAGAG